MTKGTPLKAISLTPALYDYLLQHAPEPHPILPEIAEATRSRSDQNMQISPDQGRFMHLLTKLLGAKKAVEVGCFTGYSAVAVASALPSDGKLISLDIDSETAQIAQSFFTKAGLDQKIEIKVAPALESLTALAEESSGSFDLAFIDADKVNYQAYYEKCLQLLRPGGVILADNVLWSGSIIDSSNQEESTQALRQFNEFVKTDSRVSAMILPIADGLYLAVKK